MTSLADYLANLNTSENQWYLWVNPKNIEEYRCGQDCFENGGINDGYVCIGSLDELSFGFQSTTEAIEYLLDSGEIDYKGRRVLVARKGILEAYSKGNLDNEFQEFLETECEGIKSTWSNLAADLKVDELLEYFAPGGEWEQEQAEAAKKAQAWESQFTHELEGAIA